MAINESIEIAQSKTKLVKLLCFSLLFVLAGLWLILTNPQTSNPLFNNPVIKTFAAYASTIMGGWGVYFFSRKLFDQKPGVIISEKGIYDNTTAFAFGLIPWTDIAGIYETSIQASIASKQYFIIIEVADPQKYISLATNPIKKKLLQANAKGYGSPVHLSANGLKTTHKDLLTLLTTYFEKKNHSQ